MRDGAPVRHDGASLSSLADRCATAACWTAPSLGACGARTIAENFSSGNYNVHSYLLMAPTGVDLDLTLTRTAGSWSPLLVVHDEQGTTVHDGVASHSTSALEVSSTAPADVLTNIHTHLVVGPNHAGDDLYRFHDKPSSKAERVMRRVLGTVD